MLRIASGPDRILLHEMGGIGAAALIPSRCRGPRRIFPPIASCIPNRSDETGTQRADTERPTAYRYEERPASRSAFFDYLTQGPFDRGKTCVENRAPGVEHDIPLRSEFRPVQSKGRPQTPFDPVPDDGPANGARNCKPETRSLEAGVFRFRFFPLSTEGGKQRTGDSKAMVIGGAKLSGAQDPGRSRKS